MELIAHTTSFELAAGAVAFLAGMCVGPWLAYIMSIRKGKDFRDSIRPR